MHLLPSDEIGLDDGAAAVDLDLPAGDVLALSFADSDLSALAAARGGLSLRLASLRRLAHPLSVDLLIEKTLPGTRFVLVRCLGGLDYWRYGIERLAEACRALAIPLAVLPGDDRADERLAGYGTVPAALRERLLAFFHAGGGAENMRRMLASIADSLEASRDPSSHCRDLLPQGQTGTDGRAAPFSPCGRRWLGEAETDEGSRNLAPIPLPPLFALGRDATPRDWREALASLPPGLPLVPILAYRSAVAAGDTAAVDALANALAGLGFAPLPLAITSLKDARVAAELAALIETRKPALIVATTAFSAREGEGFVLDAADCPILQAVPVGSPREAWAASGRGLSAADLAMQVALPEFDGRLGTMPVAFKQEVVDAATGLTLRRLAPDTEAIAALADLAAGWIALGRMPPAERRLALVMSDYPARGGRAGFAVGLDTPASVAAIRELLDEAGYEVGRDDGTGLMSALTTGAASFAVPLETYRHWLAGIAATARDALLAAHGAPEADPALSEGAFRFRAVAYGNLLVALQPARDGAADRKARYHDPDAPPSHAYLAFYLGLRDTHRTDALIHLGTHGTTEWLPGKATALSPACWPRLATGALPVVYPYVVDDPGEAAPAKRRLAAVTLGHLPPRLADHAADGETGLLRDLVEEYAQAQLFDPRRAKGLAADILERAGGNGIAVTCGVTRDMAMDEALTRLDAHLCDIAELPFRDGFHVFGRAEHDPASAANERANLRRALDGRFVPPGPSGSPQRGRADVLPTGRNLATLDPRAIPTRAACALGQKAAQVVIARHMQDHGEAPRRIVMDLWASPTLRTGGEDIAHALALMGVEPRWDHASTRVTGFTIRPLAKLARPRADVTLRISGAFRDTFPTQIALLDAAARTVAALDEPDDWNALAAARRSGANLARVYGPAPGRFGAGVADRALDGEWGDAGDLGAAYLAFADHTHGGSEGEAVRDDGFASRVAGAQAFVHASDTPGRDILEATSGADMIGGFAAAAARLGTEPALYSLDTSQPETPRARTVPEDISRIVHGRLSNRRWIEGQLAHGWRGAAELAETLDALFVYAATGAGVADAHFDAVFDAWCADVSVWERIEVANPQAAAAIRARLDEALRRGLWTTRRNAPAAFLSEAAE